MSLDDSIEEYIDLFERIRSRVGDNQVAIRLTEQMAQDARVLFSHLASKEPWLAGNARTTQSELFGLRQLSAEMRQYLSNRAAEEMSDTPKANHNSSPEYLPRRVP